jgi:hypothetical protein
MAHVLDQVIRKIIRAAIESFPIDKGKKAELLQWIVKEKWGRA